LSASASPALAPCGIPEAPPAAELLFEVVELEDEAAGALEDDWVADELEVDEPPPQAATSRATTTAAAASDARWGWDGVVMALSLHCRGCRRGASAL
jgi:hypothetical protein